ncbi:MAG: Uma2 family endonuclease [Defluviitaleaceae bacterium]|nr:Uma2 family endonuclease [Defluviitaleaceae bacterium]
MEALAQQEANFEPKRYTYSEYAAWEDDNRWELINGVPRMMAAPFVSHQAVSGELYFQFKSFLKGKKCRVFYSPCDVRLNHKTRDDIVVQPDLLVVCDRNKIEDGKSVKGAPDLVIEILSASTSKFDKTTKFTLYKQAGVREYWIVDPTDKTVGVYIFEQENLGMRYYADSEKIPVHVLEGCEIDLSTVFEE